MFIKIIVKNVPHDEQVCECKSYLLTDWSTSKENKMRFLLTSSEGVEEFIFRHDTTIYIMNDMGQTIDTKHLQLDK